MKAGKDWFRNTNIYEVNLRQYTQEGTINAFMPHLPRLKDMGVQTLWFMPLTAIARKNRKGSMGSYYACASYREIDPEFGNAEDFRQLVKKAHAEGFRVIIDWVANHTGWDHHWTLEHPEWYKKEDDGSFKKASGMDDIIELDYSSAALRSEMINTMKWWISEYEIDGFRCDLASWVVVDFWLEAIPQVNQMKRCFWLAEADPIESPAYMEVFDAAYSWKWMHRSEAFYRGEAGFAELVHLLQQYRQAKGMQAWFTSNHDENSWNGTEYEKYGAWARSLAVFSVCFPGIPLIYSGQELPNQKRLEFFEKDVIAWKEPELHEFYKTILGFKDSHPALYADAGLERIHTSADDRLLAFLRKEGADEVFFIMNCTAMPQRYEIYDSRLNGSFTSLFEDEKMDAGERKSRSIEAWGCRLYYK